MVALGRFSVHPQCIEAYVETPGSKLGLRSGVSIRWHPLCHRVCIAPVLSADFGKRFSLPVECGKPLAANYLLIFAVQISTTWWSPPGSRLFAVCLLTVGCGLSDPPPSAASSCAI